jgi:hypothetical protein
MADEDRPRNPYLTPLQLVSGAYFPFLAVVVLASAGLGVLALGKLPGRIGILLILTSVHVVVGLFALFRGVEEKDEFELELADKGQRGLAKLVEQVGRNGDWTRLTSSVCTHNLWPTCTWTATGNRSLSSAGR